ncbi:PREDICTED: uncharacterized protein LOC109165784 [Ipomoea nil]|uniref:uncharacterized protein LOC109165784 n=1 Tax=Ipomoea nil TaxID=35883 RepID=UPI00090152AA|nr:PREDICTED: uncharacterized protein LOC109165784 [Ipomoea nil]
MCRGFLENGPDCLKLRAFYIHLSVSTAKKALPHSLTLHYLPRIDGGALEINGSKIRADAPGFVTLHRVVAADAAVTGAVYGSRDRVKASEGARFEIYAGDSSRLVKGVFRKDWAEENWKLDCECVVAGEDDCLGIKAAEVCVAVEGYAPELITQKVEMLPPRRLRRRRCYQGLEEIPEGRETETESEPCCCHCCDEGEKEMDGGACKATEAVGWAVDMGIWMVCLGVGYFVSRASYKSLRRRLIP